MCSIGQDPWNLHQEKWITYPNVKYKLVKFLEDSIRENLDNLEFGDDFSDTIPKA